MNLPENYFEKQFWNMSPEDSIRYMNSNESRGLSDIESSDRLEKHGKNTLSNTSRTSRIQIFFRQFASPLIAILIVASIVTIVVGHYGDAVFILLAVFVNALLGFYQEDKAEQALSELKSYLKDRSRIIREGREFEIDSENIVPGDIVKLSQGDRVPSDGRILFANDLQIDEALLTGESLPALKSISNNALEAGLGDQESIVFAGTLVTQGIATVLVCRTGVHTEFGKIAELIASTESEKTPLQKAIQKFSVNLSLVLGALTFMVFLVGIAVGYSVLDMFLTSVAIAVSAIPEGLPIALTVILSVGVQRMAKRKGVVRKLIAAETLGSTTLILTDKTGTLTMAKMELTRVIPFSEMSEIDLLKSGLANTSVIIENEHDEPQNWRMDGKIMECALVLGSALRGVRIADSLHSSVVESIPFNAVQKFSITLVKRGDEHILIFYGAPDILLQHSTLNVAEKHARLAEINAYASEGKRVLGIAHKKIQLTDGYTLKDAKELENLTFDGVLTFHDPVRPGVKNVIAQIHAAGIRTIIMTGDHKGTAEAIAREVGLTVFENSALDASELVTMSEEGLRSRLATISVISRVTPFDKLRIVKIFQEAGEVVAMTGDGVNDAPSIKQANVGIAMGSGTEVAQSVADLVLLDDNFETIVAAVEEGREILSNIRKVMVYLLSNITNGLVLIGGSLVFGLALPLNPLQILWVNFFADSFPAIAYAFEKETTVFNRKPRGKSENLFDSEMKFLILIVGLSSSVLLFGLYALLLNLGFDEQVVRTFIFASFGSYSLFVALSVRSLDKSIFSYPFFSNAYLLYGIAIGLLLMVVAVYVPFLQKLFDTVPLSLPWVLGVVGVGIANMSVIEFGKWMFRRRVQ